MPPAQRQSLIRELQSQLPPAQREAILQALTGGQGGAQQQGGGTAEQGDQTAAAMPTADQLTAALVAQQPPRLEAGSTLVLEFSPRAEVPAGALTGAALADFRARLAKGNPYKLDTDGYLYLPGVPAIALAGLDIDEATIRIQAEPALAPFQIFATLLPLEPVGVAALKPFGYALFNNVPSTFAPATDIPVPADYVLGPGDTVNVQLFGNTNAEYFLTVSREGTINFPELGPVAVSGLSFPEMRDTINQRVSEQMIGVRASITLGELRSIRVFVLGDVVRPGSYTVSGLSTMTNALFASGGVEEIGSLRNIELRRSGDTVSTLDLYDLLLHGDTSDDARLQPGDVLFVPPIGPTISVGGEVRRPAVYELKNERNVNEVVQLAGGLKPTADRSAVKLERIVPGRGVTVQDLNLTAAAGGGQPLEDGDVLRVLPNRTQLERSVRLAGNVYQPGLYQWQPGMRLSDLLPSPDLVKPMSDLGYVLIRREPEPNVEIEPRSADLGAVWAGDRAADIELQARDTVYVFNLEIGRSQIIEPILDTLRAQAAPQAPVPVVRIGGQVRAEGEYPLEPGMRLSDLLRAGGGMTASAYGVEAELTRYTIENGESRRTDLIRVNLDAVASGAADADVVLQPYDYLNIKEVSRWREQQTVTLRGEVMFPGPYAIRQGETLSSVLQRAGGLTDIAFAEGSVFTRRELQEREREQLDTLARRIETDIAAISVSDPNGAEAVTTGRSLVTQLGARARRGG